MKIDDIKTPLALFAGCWIITRSVRWGFPYLVQDTPLPNSLAERIKKIYIDFTTTNDFCIRVFREFFGAIYDWVPITIASLSYMGLTVQMCNAAPFTGYVQIPFVFISVSNFSWIVMIYLPMRFLSSHGPKSIAPLARAIKPWVTPTGMFEENKPTESLMHLMFRMFFTNEIIDIDVPTPSHSPSGPQPNTN
ncbi:MAG TPA: hypothetical protein VFU89_03385 [Rhabdochlamydiaceae bacterium]|nr:hypothetical protein [Rhabdochlamydiaceae bacterium]